MYNTLLIVYLYTFLIQLAAVFYIFLFIITVFYIYYKKLRQGEKLAAACVHDCAHDGALYFS